MKQTILLTIYLFISLLAFNVHAINYTYDDLGRLTHVVYANSDTIEYSYDSAGNITRVASQVTVVAINGVCGSSHGGSFSSIPTNNLCSAGIASMVSETDSWTWSCSGSGDGNDVNCSANIIVAPVPSPSPSPSPSPTTPKPIPAPAHTPVADSTPLPAIAIDLSGSGSDGIPSVLEQLQTTSEIVGNDDELSLSQNPSSNNIEAEIGGVTFELKPVVVTQAPKGTKAGIYITDDGLIKLITDSGQQVVLLAEPQQLQELIQVFADLGFKVSRGIYGELRINLTKIKRSASDTLWYSARASIESSPVDDSLDSRTGLIAMPSSTLKNTLLYAHQFYIDDELYRQYLYPAPADWDSLKNKLNQIGEQVSIDVKGIISAFIGDISYKALMDYSVEPNPILSGGDLYFNAIDDQNNDGTNDFEVVFPSGDKQLIYILP